LKIPKLFLVILTSNKLPIAADLYAFELKGLAKVKNKVSVFSSVRDEDDCPLWL
jgi:hypothetical protein